MANRAFSLVAGREILDFLEQSLGRPVNPNEVSTELQRVWKTAKAATYNADKARRSAQIKTPAEDIAKARRQVAEQLGRLDLLESIYRRDSTDSVLNLIRPNGSHVSQESREKELFTRASVSPVSTSDGIQPVPFEWNELTGVTGTPWAGGTPAVELNSDLYPYRGRGLSYDQGQFMAAYRSDSVIREGVANLVSVMAGATIEVQAPSLTERQAELLGVNRDLLDIVAEAINVDLHFGNIDFDDAFEQMLRSGIINGFGLYEFAMNPNAPIGKRITGLSPRLPNTVMRWVFDGITGELVGVQQTNPNGNIYRSGLAPFLDIRKTVLLSIDKDGDNFEGLSLVRSARQWDLLSMEVTSASILHWQRFGPGVPVLRRSSAAPNSAAASDAAFAALSKYANLADAVLELGDGIDVELLQMQMNTGLESIIDMCAKYKRSAIRDAISGLGTESAGAYNLGDVKSQMWLKGLGVFARQIERAWSNLIRVYCDLYFPGLPIYPTLRVTGFATRSATEVLNLQTSFGTLVQSGQYTDRELVEIAEKAEIIWHGRGKEGEIDDIQTAPVADGETPTDMDTGVGSEQFSATETNIDETARAESTGLIPPPEARRNAAIGLRRKRNAPAPERWQPSIPDSILVRKIAGGEPLSQLDLRMVEAYFAGAGNVTNSPDWDNQGPAWQEFHCFGGLDMAEWLDTALAEPAQNSDIATDLVTDLAEEPATRAVRYDHIDFTPPKGVREAAKRGLEVRASKPPSQRGGTAVGVARARDLSNGKRISPDTARRMKAYFDRHEIDKQGSTWDEQGKGWQAWMLWGGDAGQAWSGKLVMQMNAADENSTTRATPHKSGCACGNCITTRARAMFDVETRTGTFKTWRNLTPVEQSVAFDRIATEKSLAVERMVKAIEAEQKLHRTQWTNTATPYITGRDVAGIANLSIDWTERYRQAILPALRSLSEFSNQDMLDEIAAQIGSNTWVATSETVTGSASQVEAAAMLASRAVNDRVNEQLRGAALQAANGAKLSVLAAAPLSVGNTGSGLLEQAASTTVNETRAATASEQGPKIEKAVYSAVMDRLTCIVCAKADGTEVDFGSDKYRQMSPPNPRCKSVTNSGGLRNLCQCVWVYEYAGIGIGPGPINATSGGGLVVRQAGQKRATLNLVVGLPGAGKSTWAKSQSGTVIDRDEYVLDGNAEYDYSGRVESLEALVEALQEPNAEMVHFVACLLSDKSRRDVIDYVNTALDTEIETTITAFDVPVEKIMEVNQARENEPRGSIPVEQLQHMIDAYELPDSGSGNVTIIALDRES